MGDGSDEAIAKLVGRAWWSVAAFAAVLVGAFSASTALRAGGLFRG